MHHCLRTALLFLRQCNLRLQYLPSLLFSLLPAPKGKKKTLYLHIGMGKTGTTALQVFFWQNRDVLARNNIHYPKEGIHAGAHHGLSPHQPFYLKKILPFIPIKQGVWVISRTKCSNILLSSELMMWIRPEQRESFIHQLQRYFHVKAVIYLRRQDSIIMAGYKQQIKAGGQPSRIEDVLEKQIKNFNYLERITPWDTLLGRENIIVLPFEKGQFHQGDIRFDFLYRVFGIEDFSGFQLSAENHNPRLSLAALEYKRLLNNLFDTHEARNRFTPALLAYSAMTDTSSTQIYAKADLLSPEQRRHIMECCEPINADIARRYLNRPDGQLFYEKMPEQDANWKQADISPEILHAITDFLQQNASDEYEILYKRLTEAASSDKENVRNAAFALTPKNKSQINSA